MKTHILLILIVLALANLTCTKDPNVSEIDGPLMSFLSVYPNPPTGGKFTVSISNSEAVDMTIELVNISGKVFYHNEVKAAYSYNEEIDASMFATGEYYLKVNQGKEIRVQKIILP